MTSIEPKAGEVQLVSVPLASSIELASSSATERVRGSSSMVDCIVDCIEAESAGRVAVAGGRGGATEEESTAGARAKDRSEGDSIDLAAAEARKKKRELDLVAQDGRARESQRKKANAAGEAGGGAPGERNPEGRGPRALAIDTGDGCGGVGGVEIGREASSLRSGSPTTHVPASAGAAPPAVELRMPPSALRSRPSLDMLSRHADVSTDAVAGMSDLDAVLQPTPV